MYNTSIQQIAAPVVFDETVTGKNSLLYIDYCAPRRGPQTEDRPLKIKGWIGGAREDRTPDLLNAIQALSQLSYGPETARNVR